MKTSECTAEAFLCIIAIFHCNIQYLRIRGSKLISRKSEPAHADIISQCIAAQDTENTLKMERGGIGLLRNLIIIQVFGDMSFHIIHSFLNSADPIHFL